MVLANHWQRFSGSSLKGGQFPSLTAKPKNKSTAIKSDSKLKNRKKEKLNLEVLLSP